MGGLLSRRIFQLFEGRTRRGAPLSANIEENRRFSRWECETVTLFLFLLLVLAGKRSQLLFHPLFFCLFAVLVLASKFAHFYIPR